MREATSSLVTIMFTDLVGSTELFSRAGDEDAQRIFRAHHDLLAEVAAVHRGEEVKWLGDGLMVAFPSAADAVRAAVAMQQASRRSVRGEHLAIRVGLNAGEALRDAADWFGTPVVVARRLCDRADAGQILCSAVVATLLEGRDFTFSDLGELEVKGMPKPVGALSVEYEPDAAGGLAVGIPCVGRDAELRRLTSRLGEAAAGRGGLVLVAGEAGIGKTRLVTELAGLAEREGARVLWGHCYEGEWTPPYAPFVEAIDAHVAAAPLDGIRADLGSGTATLAELVPRLRSAFPDLPPAVPLSPDEERFRIIDAVTRFLTACSLREPLLLCLDDLHWVDKGSVGMLRQLIREAVRHRLLVIGTYRDAEIGAGHPLAEALGTFARETSFEKLALKGLGAEGTAELLGAFGDQEVEQRVGAAWVKETAGNPFFIAELARHLVEEGTLYRGPDGRWTTDRPLSELSLPDSVRDVVARRVARLSDSARRLLAVACAFEGPFRFDVVAGVAELGEDAALDAVDEALGAQALEAAGPADTYVFHHALIRHALYDQVSPSRRLRLHRRVAQGLEAVSGSQLEPATAGEIAAQWHRSAGLPGAERGVDPALAAADHAQTRGGHDEAVRFLRIALDLLPEGDDRRPRLLGRLGIVLAWALSYDEAAAVAAEAGDAIAESESKSAAAEYLADATYACAMAGGVIRAWDLARQGLLYAEARDVAWARLLSFDYERRAAENPERPGVAIDDADRRQAARILREARLDPLGPAPMEAVFDTREEALESSNLMLLCTHAGEFVRCLPLAEAIAIEAEKLGRLNRAARGWGTAAVCQVAMGRLEAAQQSIDRANALADRLGLPVAALLYARESLSWALGSDDEGFRALAGALARSADPALAWATGAFSSMAARAAARLGRTEEALGHVTETLRWLEQAPAWTLCFPAMVANCAETLWLFERLDHVEVIERTLREKVIGPDFRPFGADARLAFAWICALRKEYDEALGWFAAARRVLSEQGAPCLLAVCDFDEALMYIRRGDQGDAERARPLVAAARRQFEELGMTGWITRADGLAARLG